MDTTEINLRGVPTELKRFLKAQAASQGISMKDLCVMRLATESYRTRHGHCPACVDGQSLDKGDGTHREATHEHPDAIGGI